jgi:anti-anti-sigma factor
MPTTITLVTSDDSHTHVQIIGPLDLSGVQAIELKFTAHTASRRKPAIVDVSQVTIIASLGMGMLLQVARALAAHRAKLVLLAPTPQVDGALRTAKLDMLLAIAADLDAAHAHAGIAPGASGATDATA